MIWFIETYQSYFNKFESSHKRMLLLAATIPIKAKNISKEEKTSKRDETLLEYNKQISIQKNFIYVVLFLFIKKARDSIAHGSLQEIESKLGDLPCLLELAQLFAESALYAAAEYIEKNRDIPNE